MNSEFIEATNYIHRGKMLILRSALNIDDLESWQSLWIKKFGNMKGFPYEQLGFHVPEELCPHCGRDINE